MLDMLTVVISANYKGSYTFSSSLYLYKLYVTNYVLLIYRHGSLRFYASFDKVRCNLVWEADIHFFYDSAALIGLGLLIVEVSKSH